MFYIAEMFNPINVFLLISGKVIYPTCPCGLPIIAKHGTWESGWGLGIGIIWSGGLTGGWVQG